MRKLSTEKRTTILRALVEGNSINATARLCGCSKITVLRLLADAGTMAARWHDEHVRGLQAERVQADEIWSFVHGKDKNLPDHLKLKDGFGSVWTWVGLDADSKIVISWHIGDRNQGCAKHFMLDLASRIENRIQLSTDGLSAYLPAVLAAFDGDVDYAQLVKIYGTAGGTDGRYSPCECIGTSTNVVAGDPLPEDINTSYIERQNLTMRMQMRRYTRLTNGHSKKIENHEFAVALHFFHYNWCRKHQTLKTTPAVASGIASKRMDLSDLVEMIEAEEARTGRRVTGYLPAASSK